MESGLYETMLNYLLSEKPSQVADEVYYTVSEKPSQVVYEI